MAARKKAAAKAAEPAAVREANKAAEIEDEKLHGQTAEQKALRKYHEGAFQTHDPVTGEKRDKPLS